MTLVGIERPGGASGKTAQLAKLVSELGPDIPEISRRLGQFRESVRYRYKTKLLDKGMAIQASVDHEKLGLKRVAFMVDFAPEYDQYAQPIMVAMSDLCYVTGFERTMPEGSYLVNASVPVEFVNEFTDFLRGLETNGLFRCTKVMVFDWFRIAPMCVEHYDFDTGRWDFDWTGSAKPGAWTYVPQRRADFDSTDLLLIKELRIDATRSMVEIAKKLGVSYKKLFWHYTAHVRQRSLIRGYSLNWMGTGYDLKIEKALHRKHRYFTVDLVAENLSDMERMDLISKTNSLPFLWAEMGGKDYLAQFAFPVDSIVEAYEYLMRAVGTIKDRVRIIVANQMEALSFTISYKLYDERSRSWTFNKQELADKFRSLLLKMKEGAGR